MPSLNVNITSGEKGSLYNLEIQNTQVDDVKGIGSYAATLSGVGLEGPLTVKLRKFNRSLGAVKLTSRVLGRIFRKHMDKLVTMTPQAATPTKTRTRTRTAKQAKGNGNATTAAAPAPAPTPAPAPAPAPVPVPEPVAAIPVSGAFQV
jgi:hypothetical protein